MADVDLWMPLYIGDYMSGTSRLTTEQHGAYLLLIMDYWKNGALPDNDAILAQITRLPPDAWSMHRAVLEHFFTVENGEWKHKRIEREMDAARDKKQKASEKAKAAAQARWEKDAEQQAKQEKSNEQCSKHATSNAQAMHEECPSPSPSPSPLQTPGPSQDIAPSAPRAGKQRKPKRATQLPEDFEPSENNRQVAAEQGVSIHDQLPQFRDYHRAKGSTMKDWHAALNTWLRNAKKFDGGRTGKPPQETPHERGQRMARERGIIQ